MMGGSLFQSLPDTGWMVMMDGMGGIHGIKALKVLLLNIMTIP